MEKPSLAAASFSPRSLALFGAVDTPGKNNSKIYQYLREHGYNGEIIPVNPMRD